MLQIFSLVFSFVVGEYISTCHAGLVASATLGPVPIGPPTVNLAVLERQLNPTGIVGACLTNDSDSNVGVSSGNPWSYSRWRNGYIVQLSSQWSPEQVRLIEGALYEISTKICIPILKWAVGSRPRGDYVYIQKGRAGTGCYSTGIGRQGGWQIINLQDPGCVTKGMIIHENIHAMGFNHEQTRPDRNNYINVYRNEIQRGKEHAYDIYRGSLTFGVPYDFSSVMHYGSYDFSRIGNPTMRKRDGSLIVRQ